jgi:hypothetical protein
MLFRRTSFCMLGFWLLMGVWLNSCNIEKRLYQPGWHVEWPQRKHDVSLDGLTEKRHRGEERIGQVMECSMPRDTPNVHSVILDQEPMIVAIERENQSNGVAQESKLHLAKKSDYSSEVAAAKRMHPKAGLSFLMGSVSIACIIIPLLVSGLGLTVLIALAVLLIISALLAQKWSKIALEDMYMARNRYSGKALAAAGMILSILALVGLVGVIVIGLLGLAFLSVA